jgi:predicted small metal-binding protein
MAIILIELLYLNYCRRKEVITMAEMLKKLECDPKCGFVIQSHDEKEIIEVAMQHAKKSHNMQVTEKEAKAMIKDA